MYDIRPSPPCREANTIGDRRSLRVEYVGSMDVVFHRYTDKRCTLADVSYVPGLGFNLYSLYADQRTNRMISDVSVQHIIGTNVTFPRNRSGSYLRSTRVPARTVGAKRKADNIYANNILRHLRHPIPLPLSDSHN